MNAASLIIILASNGGHWLSGTDGVLTVTWAAPEGAVAARLVWELRLDGATLAKDSVNLEPPKRPQGGADAPAAALVRIRCPDVRARTVMIFRWRIERREGGQEVDRGEMPIHAYPADLTNGWNRLLQGRRVAVIDKPDGLPALLDGAKVKYTRFDAAGKLALERPQVVLVGPGALEDSPFAQAPLIDQARSGASVMVFRQPAPRALAGYPLTTRAAPAAIDWEREHPLLARFEEGDLTSWLHSWRREDRGNLTAVMELPPDEPAVAVAAWPAGTEVATSPAPVTALLVCKAVGDGRLVLCQMPLGDWRSDPRSQVFLGNALDYLVSPPEPTPPPSRRRRAEPRPVAPVPTITIPPGDKP
jgi:hypothetical protein